jgi:hypothetical protein
LLAIAINEGLIVDISCWYIYGFSIWNTWWRRLYRTTQRVT